MSELGEGINWGTSTLDRDDFTGIIREAEWQKGKEEYGSKTQLMIRIEPTSFEADEESWLLSWYSHSSKKDSKWGALNAALEKVGHLPRGDPSDLVGKEFEFERRNVDCSGRGEDQYIAKKVILPTKFIKDHGKKTSKASAPAEATSPAPKPKKAAKKAEKVEEPSEEVDVEVVLIEVLRKEGGTMVDEKAIQAVADMGIKKTDAFLAVKKLVKSGVVDLNAEEGILVLKE